MHDENMYLADEEDTAPLLPLIRSLMAGTELEQFDDGAQFVVFEQRIMARIEIIASELHSERIVEWVNKGCKVQKTKAFDDLWPDRRNYWGLSGKRRRERTVPSSKDVFDISNIDMPPEGQEPSALATPSPPRSPQLEAKDQNPIYESSEDKLHGMRRKANEVIDRAENSPPSNKRQKMVEPLVILKKILPSLLTSCGGSTLAPDDPQQGQEVEDMIIFVDTPEVIYLISSHVKLLRSDLGHILITSHFEELFFSSPRAKSDRGFTPTTHWDI
jgi:hypothetical protein